MFGRRARSSCCKLPPNKGPGGHRFRTQLRPPPLEGLPTLRSLGQWPNNKKPKKGGRPLFGRSFWPGGGGSPFVSWPSQGPGPLLGVYKKAMARGRLDGQSNSSVHFPPRDVRGTTGTRFHILQRRCSRNFSTQIFVFLSFMLNILKGETLTRILRIFLPSNIFFEELNISPNLMHQTHITCPT